MKLVEMCCLQPTSRWKRVRLRNLAALFGPRSMPTGLNTHVNTNKQNSPHLAQPVRGNLQPSCKVHKSTLLHDGTRASPCLAAHTRVHRFALADRTRCRARLLKPGACGVLDGGAKGLGPPGSGPQAAEGARVVEYSGVLVNSDGT